MKKAFVLPAVALVLFASGPAPAHFGMLIPSKPTISQGDPRTLELKLSFSHPFEGVGMEMAKPRAFGVAHGGTREDLLSTLKPARVMDRGAWAAAFTFKKPGVHIFYMEPEPYWEPAEDAFIVHYAKAVVPAFGIEEGWDAEIGLKTEIVPLTRPYGLYAANAFQGIVKCDGKPVPFATVEVEFYNRSGQAEAPTEYMIAQVVRADGNGVFTYAAPKAGWWGFAALSTADFTLKKDGKDKAVEIGAVLWVYFHEWRLKK